MARRGGFQGGMPGNMNNQMVGWNPNTYSLKWKSSAKI